MAPIAEPLELANAALFLCSDDEHSRFAYRSDPTD